VLAWGRAMRRFSEWGVFQRVLVVVVLGFSGASAALWGDYRESRYQAARRDWQAGKGTDESCVAAKARRLDDRFLALRRIWVADLEATEVAQRVAMGPAWHSDLSAPVAPTLRALIQRSPNAAAFLALDDDAIHAALPRPSAVAFNEARHQLGGMKIELEGRPYVPTRFDEAQTAEYLRSKGIDPALFASCERWPPVPPEFADSEGKWRSPDYLAVVIGGGTVASLSALVLAWMGIGRFIGRGRSK
jgi:hypothetical protein